MTDSRDPYVEAKHSWYDIRNWRLWAAISATLLVACVTFALVTTTLDRNDKNAQLSEIAREQRCRGRLAAAVQKASADKFIDQSQVNEILGDFVVAAINQDKAAYPEIAQRIENAVTTSRSTSAALRKATDAYTQAIESCKEASK